MSHADVEQTIERELPRLPGWCTPEKGRRLAALAIGADLCVELGVFGGRSLISIALGLLHGRSGQVHGIDPFTATAALEGTNDPRNDEWWRDLEYDSIARAAQEAIYRLGLVRHAQLVRMRSREVVEYYADGSVDLLHQDSNHSEEISCEEVELWTPKLRARGYWIFDDTDWPSTKKAQLYLESLGFQELEDHGGWKVYRKS